MLSRLLNFFKNFSFGVGLFFFLAHSAVATNFPSIQPHIFKADSYPSVGLTNGILFQLVASEIALQRGELGAAYQTYISMAKTTKDPRLAERAVQIAQVAQAPNEIRNATILWNELSPGSKLAQKSYINIGLHFEEYQTIFPVVEQYLAQLDDPGRDLVEIQLALCKNKNKKEALSFFKSISAPYNQLPETQLGLARLSLLNGDIKISLSTAQNAFKRKPDTDSLLVLVNTLLKVDLKKALALLDNYLLQHPTNIKVRNVYTQLLIATKDYEKLNNIAKKYASDGPYTITVALELLQKKNTPNAVKLLKNYILLSEKDWNQGESVGRAYLLLSEIALSNQEIAASLAYANKVTDPSLKNMVNLQIANIYAQEGDKDKAIFYLDSINTEDQEQKEKVVLFKARLISELKGDLASLAYLEKLIKEDPDSKELCYLAAMKAGSTGNIKLMEHYFQSAIRIDPLFANAYNSYGYTLLEQTSRIKDAEKYIKKAYNLDSKNPFILDSMGWLYYKKGNYTKAVEYLIQSIKLSKSKEKEIYIHLVQALWKKGNQSEAIQVLNTALKMWPTSSELRDLKKYFSKLKSGS
ncbi:MAG: tetratricopeptide repeat protein [Burkholderiaceae bacterium]|nr:tetratricopeptide repeat protein [Burkholderiaceae bacterium]